MLMFDRLDQPPSALDERDADAFLRGRVPVFDVSNLWTYLSDNTSTDVFTHPYGPPFRTYWIEFKVDDHYETGVTKIGMLCQTVDDPVDTGSVTPTTLFTMWFQQHKKPVGPVVTWKVTFSPDDAPSYEVLHAPDHAALDLLLNGRIRSSGSSDYDPVDNLEPEIRDRARRLLATKDSSTLNADDVAFLDEVIAILNAKVQAATARATDLRDQSVNLIVGMYLWEALKTVLFTHALLACNNVGTETREPPAALSKKHARKNGRGLVAYKVIQVAPMGGTGPSRNGTGSGTPDALHIVRGHFKTFTKERPLFGRHTGTYWWTPTVKGNASSGVIVSDYKVPTG